MWCPDGPQASVARTPFYTVLWAFVESPRHLELLRRRASKRAHINMLYSLSLAHRGGDWEGIWFLADTRRQLQPRPQPLEIPPAKFRKN